MKLQENTGTKRRSKICIAAAAAILACGAGSAVYMGAGVHADTQPQTNYREYTVSKGNITVGVNESGTVSFERAYVTFPCDAEVSEVYVREGTQVVKGDPLVKLCADDISEAKEELYSSVKSAKLALEQAETEKNSKLLNAQQTYEAAISNGKSARTEYELYTDKSDFSEKSAAEQLEDLKSELEEYKLMNESYPSDYRILTDYESTLDKYESEYKSMENEYRSYQKIDEENADSLEEMQDKYNEYVKDTAEDLEKINELKANYESAKEKHEKCVEAYTAAKDDSSNSFVVSDTSGGGSEAGAANTAGTAAESSSESKTSSEKTSEEKLAEAEKAMNESYTEYNSANIAYSPYYIDLGEEISDTMEEYEDKISELEKIKKAHEKETNAYKKQMDEFNEKISEYRSAYEDFKEDFNEIYGQNDADSIYDRIKSLNSSISEAELNIESSAAEEESQLLQARQKAESAEASASSAQEVYNQTVALADEEVERCRKDYNNAVSEYEEFCETVSDSGIIYAECSGTVAGVSVSEGSDIKADTNLVTLMDSSCIYLSSAVSEEDVTSLYIDQECSVSLTAYENKTFSGYIDTISAEPARSSGSVSYTVTVRLDDGQSLNVREGMSGEVTFLQKQVKDVLYANINAVSFKDGASYIMVCGEDGNVTSRQVTTGFTDGRYVEISDGVSAGDKVLAEIELSEKGRRN